MNLPAQIAVTMVLAALVAGGWFWLGDGNDAAASRSRGKSRGGPTLVLTEAVAVAHDTVQVRATGTAKAHRSATIHASVAGKVTTVSFTAGQAVSTGAPLVRLDDEHQKLAVALANVAVKQARRQVKRLEPLSRRGATSVADLLTAGAELESAILNEARAKEALADRTVVAPFDGIIGLTAVEPGDRIDERMPIATLDDRSFILVQFNLPEAYAGVIRVGDRVSVQPWTTRGAPLEGTVSALDSRIDAATRSLKVEATIPNADDLIRPGTSFEVRKTFVGRAYPNIREVAVLWSRDGAYVWRNNQGKAEKVFVTVVRRNKGRILVDGPLTAGDEIVVEGVQGLRVGQAIAGDPLAGSRARS